jgi:hypothetical protein
MPKPTWHNRVKTAIMEMGEDYGYEAHTGIVYYKIGRNRFRYLPDVLWLYSSGNRFKPFVYVWEIESGWIDTKRICGDCILAFKMLPDNTTFFTLKGDSEFGRVLKKNVTMPTYWGTPTTYRKDYHRIMNLNATGVIVVTEKVGHETYWKRYVHAIANTTQFTGTCKMISVPRSCASVDDVKHRLAHLKDLRKVI